MAKGKKKSGPNVFSNRNENAGNEIFDKAILFLYNNEEFANKFWVRETLFCKFF
jgi:hypothetical protein